MYNRNQFEILDNDVVISYVRNYRINGCIESRDKVVLSNIRAAQYIANKFGRNHREALEDLMHEGIVAIIDSINNYDLSSHTKFSTYCYTYIRGYMLNKLNQKFNKTLSLDFEYDDGMKPLESMALSNDNTGLENMIRNETIKRLSNALGLLNERDRKIIEMYFGLFNKKGNQEQIGNEFNLTKQAIGQIIKRNLEILRSNMEQSK